MFSAGIRPRDELGPECRPGCRRARWHCNRRFCRTSDPHIYAIGECALWRGKVFGLVAPGYQMAQVRRGAAIVGTTARRRVSPART